jgi:SAM-dependent methyltransferase
MTALLLDALAGLDVARGDALGRYALAIDGLPLLRTLIRSWSQLSVVVRNGEPLVRADTAEGASDLYPDFLPVLSAMFTPAAHRAARLLAGRGADVLDVGAGSAPWSIALATASPAVHVTALDLPAVIATTRRAVDAANLSDRFDYLPGDAFTTELPKRPTTWCYSRTFATSSMRRTTVHCYDDCAQPCATADWSRSSTFCHHTTRPISARSACMRSASAFAHPAALSIRSRRTKPGPRTQDSVPYR